MSATASHSSQNLKWYQGIDRYCWIVLVIAALGWLFDTMDQNLYNLVRAPSITELLRPHFANDPVGLTAAVKAKGGIITSIFLIGWSLGGFIFGMLGDRIGRTGTMVLTILIYAIFTGLSGAPFVQSWELYAFMRFMTAVGVGGEWAAGAALVAEVFPNRSRAMALGLLQALSAVGNMMAAVVTLVLSGFEGGIEQNWRIAYFVGAVPALLVLWIRKAVKEPEAWHEAKSVGQELGNIGELFTHPVLRRNTIAAMLMATAGVGALWGVGFFSTDLVRAELKPFIGTVLANGTTLTKEQVGQQVSSMFLLQNLGAFFGMYLFALHSERTNRRTALFIWFAAAWASVLTFFWSVGGAGDQALGRAMMLAPVMGFCTLGPLSGFTIYFPELFPTRLRTTGCGFCYNAARILAAAAPWALGSLAPYFAAQGFRGEGMPMAATVVTCIYLLGFVGTAMGPETKGKPLPA